MNPISPKVVAAAAGAGAGAILSTLILWIIGVTAYDVAPTSDSVDLAVAAVPGPISGLVLLLLTVAAAAVPGYVTTDPQRVPVEDGPGPGDGDPVG